MNKADATIYIPGTGDMDVRRVTLVTPNELADGGRTFTLTFDGAHDDTDAVGRVLPAGKVGDHSGGTGNPMPKDARANVGNRATFSEEQLSRAGFFDIYNEINGTDYGPSARKSERRATE